MKFSEASGPVGSNSISEAEAVALAGSEAEMLKNLAKLESARKFSASVSMTDTAGEFEDDDYVPHFQRVFISGDDNTGVRDF